MTVEERLAALEQKVDGIVSIIRTTVGPEYVDEKLAPPEPRFEAGDEVEDRGDYIDVDAEEVADKELKR